MAIEGKFYVKKWIPNAELVHTDQPPMPKRKDEPERPVPPAVELRNYGTPPENFFEGNFESEWKAVNAVKNNRVYKTPIGLYRWDTQCVEAPLMGEWLAKVINPEVYTEYDFQEELRNFYSKYMNYELTDEDMAMILHTDENVYLDLNDEIYAKK